MLEKLYESIDENVRRVGWSVIGVTEDYPFFYSVGLALQGLPELLLVLPLAPQGGMDTINLVAKKILEIGEVRLGELDLGGKYSVRLEQCEPWVKDEYAVQAGEYYLSRGRRDLYSTLSVVRVVAPDEAGRFPGDPRCDPRFSGSQVLKRLAERNSE